MAPVMAFMAVKMFWKMHLVKALLSSSEKPRPWMIRICRMKVVFPLSPVPEKTHGTNKSVILSTRKLRASPHSPNTYRSGFPPGNYSAAVIHPQDPHLILFSFSLQITD